jgi:hypothetical protein
MAHGDGRAGGREIGTASLLFSLLGGPAAWTLHLFVSYFVVAVGCAARWRGTDAALAAVTVVFVAVAAAAGVSAYRGWRREKGAQPWDATLAEPGGRTGFLMAVGILAAVLFGLVIILAGLPPLFVPTCG